MKRIFAFLLMPFVLGCNSDNNPNPIAPLGNNFTYPMAIGNTWSYTVTSSITNFRPNKPGAVFPRPPITAMADIEIVRFDTLDDGVEAFVFSGTLIRENGEPVVTESYYSNLDDGMFLYQIVNPIGNHALPKPSNRGWVWTILAALQPSDERLVRMSNSPFLPSNYPSILTEKPLMILSYPLTIDKQWGFDAGYATNMMKEVMGVEKVQVPAGQFDCVKIQWLFNNEQQNQRLEFFEFISSVGLIKRVFIAKDLPAITESSPDPVGLVDTQDEIVLTNFNLR